MGKKICRYILPMHRSSDIEGVFIMTDEELATVKELEGYEVNYGEISGKHSDVSCPLHYEHIEILSDNDQEVEFFERILPTGAGFGFKDHWFCTERAYDEGYEAGEMKCYADADVAIKDYPTLDNAVMRGVFVEGFNRARE